MKRKNLFPIAMLLAVSASAFAAAAVSKATGDWDVAANWSTGAVPTNADNVFVRSGYTITLASGDTRSASSLQIANQSTVGVLNIDATELGLVSTTTYSNIGSGANANGTLNLTNGAALQGGSLGLALGNGASASANLNLASGSAMTLSTLSLSSNANAVSTVSLSGSMATVENLFLATGSANILLQNSTMTVSTALTQSSAATGTKVIALTNSTLFAPSTATLSIGSNTSAATATDTYSVSLYNSTVSSGGLHVGYYASTNTTEETRAARVLTLSGNSLYTVTEESNVNVIIGNAAEGSGGTVWIKDTSTLDISNSNLNARASSALGFGISNASLDEGNTFITANALAVGNGSQWIVSNADMNNWSSDGAEITIALLKLTNATGTSNWSSIRANLDISGWNAEDYGALQVLVNAGDADADRTGDAYSFLWIDESFNNIYLTMNRTIPEPSAAAALLGLGALLLVARRRR